MKKIYTLLMAVIITTLSFGQAPRKMSYQAIIRDASGSLVNEQEIGIKITILQGAADGTVVYLETQTPETNKNGLVSIEIGGGAGFADIDWSAGPYFINTETDPEGGTNYRISGTNQLLTVPYALHAKTAETISEPIVESDPVFEAHLASDIEATDISNWDEAYFWGDHSEEDYLTEETDPVFAVWDKSEGITITESQITDLQTYLTDISEQTISELSDIDVTGLETGMVLKYDAESEKWVVADDEGIIEETDPLFIESVASAIEDDDIDNWNKAYSWGDHSAEDYLTEETDPVFTSSEAFNITDAGSGEVITDAERVKLSGIDGSETKLSSGTRITVTGTGTEADPYIVNAVTAGATTYEIGDFAHGGVVFYVEDCGTKGLVAALEDQDGGYGVKWIGDDYNYMDYYLTNAIGEDIYEGKENTLKIIAVHSAKGDFDDYAALVCTAYMGGFGDWYLPSREELNQMWLNKSTIDATAEANGGTALSELFYWSSTEYYRYDAFAISFNTGSMRADMKHATNKMRAVRAF